MNSDAALADDNFEEDGSDARSQSHSGRSPEEWFVVAALVAMVVLPLANIVLRSIFHLGLWNEGTLVQHLTLFVGMAGSALAARHARLLTLATGSWIPAGWAATSRWFSLTVAATVAGSLALASAQFAAAEREAGQTLVPGVPLWIVLGALPLGFGAITLRLLLHASPRWAARLVAIAAVSGLVAASAWLPVSPSSLVWPAMALLLAATLLGAPLFALLGGAGLILFRGADLPIAAMSVEHYRLTVNPALPAIPLFTLAGYFMAEGGSSRRLVQLLQALFGWFRGGPAIAVTLICAVFTAFTGGSGVTILALGGLLMPVLAAARYSDRDALGLITGSGSLGILLPPCLPVILYAIVAKTDIRDMFLGGLLPGLLLITLTALWGIWAGRKNSTTLPAFDTGLARRAIWAANGNCCSPSFPSGRCSAEWPRP